MLRSLEKMRGHRIVATDDEVGRCHDFLFDDRRWTVRYVVVDTGTWLPGRRVLVSPAAVERTDWEDGRVHLDLPRGRIEKSPPLGTHAPVSFQYEQEFARYYGYPFYWGGPAPWGMHPTPQAYAMASAKARADTRMPEGDLHLRSFDEVRGYRIHAADDTLGTVEDLLIDEATWEIRIVVVKTGGWLEGRAVLIPPSVFDRIDWPEGTFHTDLTAGLVREAPAYDPSQPAQVELAERLYAHYGGRPK